MTHWTRRKFGCFAGASLLAAFRSRAAKGRAKARVVVIGGGVAGATVAKYLAASAATLDVTLVEPKRQYTTCFFSNLYLAGLRSFESLTHRYETLAQRYGITVVHDAVTVINPEARSVSLKGGAVLPYDRAVVAPGIDFEYGAIEGYDEAATETMPHAWNAGSQTTLLRRQLESMEDGGVFVLVAPPEPSRCPPGPYERASLIAYYFKQHKPHSKILILDAKDSFVEQELFQDGWNRHYPGMIEWLPRQFTGGTKAVDVKGRSVETASETFAASVANIIPRQLAGRLAQQAGLADQSGWCLVDPMTFESKLQPGIYVVGDATSAGAMPKSAFAANTQAKVCAFAILTALTGSGSFAPHLYSNCFTFLAPDDAVSTAVSFKPTDGTLKISNIFISKVGENAEARRQTAREAEGWYASFTHDLFG
jgi:NADPH-dependent 2,4-dienoyl-CoA reductase/sulfur reductase-like enzyme